MRVILCVDPLVSGPRLEKYNLPWMTGMLGRPISLALGYKPQALGARDFDRARFFALSGLACDPEATLQAFEPGEIQTPSMDFLRQHIPEGSVVVGFELTEATRLILDRLGACWIDIWQHPIRFLDDVLFAFASSDPGIHAALNTFDLPEETFWLYANRAATLIQLRGGGPELPEGSGVFIGQTLADKAILKEGRYLSLLDYQAEFRSFCQRCSRVYYSRHPMVEQGDEAILQFLAGFGNVEVGSHPAYGLLADARVREVMTISSSVALEATYFGKEVTTLHRPVLRLGSGPDRAEYRSVYQDFLSPHFWSTVLAPVAPTRPTPKVAFLDGKDKLRDMLDWQYNYKILDKAEAMRSEFEELKRFKTTLSFLTAALRARSEGHRSVLLCGAGALAPRAAKALRLAGLEIAAFTDRNPRRQGSLLEGAPVLSLEEGLRRGLPCIVGSTGFTREIAQDIRDTAERLGLPPPPTYLPETLG